VLRNTFGGAQNREGEAKSSFFLNILSTRQKTDRGEEEAEGPFSKVSKGGDRDSCKSRVTKIFSKENARFTAKVKR